MGQLRDQEAQAMVEFMFEDEMDMMSAISMLDWFRYHEPLWKESPFCLTWTM
jgi:hypothetical protein